MIQKIKAYNHFHVSKKRNEHIGRVVAMAKELAVIYNLSEHEQEQLEMACLLHDSTKDFSNAQLEHLLKNENEQLLNYPQPIWHSFASAILARDYFKISDPIIFEAIYYHTIGNAQMNIVSKLLFLADFIEIGREFPEATLAREKALSGALNEALIIEVESMRQHLAQQGEYLMTETENLYKELREGSI